MSVPSVQDASFFELVHQLLKAPAGDDRRARSRQTYMTKQMFAPYRDGVLPRKKQFQPILCQDLSTSGVSFLLPERPDYDRLIIGLSSPGETIYLTAAVIHCSEVESPTAACLVGCKFLGRVML